MGKIVLLMMMMSWILGGCGATANWEAKLQTPSTFSADQTFPLILEINENGKPLTGLQVHALLEMKKMDHGTVNVDFKESSTGKYEGSPTLPMGGEWVAIVQMTNGKQSKEQTIVFEAEE